MAEQEHITEKQNSEAKTDLNIYQRLLKAQAALVAPKQAGGRFGKARSAEQILEAAKPVCRKHGLFLHTSDEVEVKNGRNYVTSTATVINVDKPEEFVIATASAWEGEMSRGLDAPQVTGAASSYAKKYALQNLFAIDDTKDPDYMDEEVKVASKPANSPKLDQGNLDLLRTLMEADGIQPAAISMKLKTLDTDEKVKSAIAAMQKKLAGGEAA